MVRGKGVVYRVWENIKAIVKEKNEKQYDERKEAELDGSANLAKY